MVTRNGTASNDTIVGNNGTNDVLNGLGGNDLLRGLKPADSQANMEAMVKKLQDRDIEAVSYTHLTLPTTPYV